MPWKRTAFAVAPVVAVVMAGLSAPACRHERRPGKGERLRPAICNTTYGSVTEVIVWRNLNTTEEYGFFELLGPNGYKQTAPTNRESDHTFKVNRSLPNAAH